MIVRTKRFAGAILMEGAGQFFLVGNTKEPCDWSVAGFEAPPELLSGRVSTVRINTTRAVEIQPPHFFFNWNANALELLVEIVANRLLIERNGSVSERLWRLITGESDERTTTPAAELDVTWLASMPEAVWKIVRETVLKCL